MKKWLPILVLLFNLSARSQQGYTFNRISTDDALGLSSNNVYCIYQDKQGFMWVGTSNGLQRFDGNKFISFGSSRSDQHQLPASDLSQIIPADHKRLWLFFGARQEIGLYDPVSLKYEVIPIKTTGRVPSRSNMHLWKDSQGEIFFFISNYAILHFNKSQKAFVEENYLNLPKGWVPGQNIFEDTVKKQIWITCKDSGIAIFDRKTGKTYTPQVNPLNIPILNNKEIMNGASEIFIDSRRRHWVFNWTNQQNKNCFDENGNRLTDTIGLNQNPEYSELTSFFETKQGVLWVFGANCLFNFDNNEKRFFFYEPGRSSPTGISYNSVYNIIEDKDSSIWVCTDNGLYFTTPGSGTTGVVNILFDERKGGIEITDLLQLDGGQYWLSTWGRGVITLDKNFNSYSADIYKKMPAMDPVSNSQYRQTWALYQHKDGKIWVGCQAGKYMVYDTLLKKTFFGEIEEAEKATIRYITGDHEGNLWFSTQRGHIIKYDGKKFSKLQLFNTIISKILVDNDGLLWLATFNQGLYCLSKDGTKIIYHFTSNTKENALYINTGDDIDQINDSTIAYGAGALNLINKKTGKVTWLTFEDGLPVNSIQRIRADANGNLWMITKNGLCKYNPKTNRFTPFGRKDGITLANMTNIADFFSKEGYVMFTGANALMYFLPAIYENKTAPPNVVITDFKLLNEYVPVDSLLDLPQLEFRPNQNSFAIYFSSLSYSQKEKLTYYYKMEGIDKDWVKADRQSFVNYRLLPAGRYTFSVYCENIDGMRSPEITSFKIWIRPPFWKTYWFLSSLLFITLLFIYLLQNMRIKRLMAVETIRNRVARDLHDDMGSTLSTINILSTMAKSKLNTDSVKTSEYISKISENSQRMMEAMDDIVWSIKPTNDSMQKIVARMREYATSILEARNIEVVFNIQDEVENIRLNMEARRDFFLVFKEAVNNAAKYSKATKVEISLEVFRNTLQLIVRDNGHGFNVSIADSGNGLNNMQKRADAMQGKLQVNSSEEKGTSVILKIPHL